MPRALAAAVLLVLLAGCGGDDGADPAPYVDAVRADLESGDDGTPLRGEAAGCVAEAIVEAADADRLEDAEVTPQELAEAESFDDVDLDVEAEELRSSLEESLADCPLGEPLAEVFTAELPQEVPADQQECLARSLDDGDEVPAALAAAFVDGDDSAFEAAFAAALTACPDVAAGLVVAGVEGSLGAEVSAEARACLTEEMESRGREGVDRLLAGGAEAQTLGEEIGTACQAELAG